MKHLFALIAFLFAMPTCAQPFIQTRGVHFHEAGSQVPLYFKGTNLWYAPILASEGAGGDRPRLHRELARLQQMGVTNLRVLAFADRGSVHAPYVQPLAHDVAPDGGAAWNDTLLVGLDYLLAVLPQYGMRAVLYLTNAWDWSGGMGYYLERTGHGPSPSATGNGWGEYCRHIAQFYTDADAIRLYHDAIRHLLTRTNSVTGCPYAEDAAIFAWQLCNEPRPFARSTEDAFIQWADTTSRLIRSLAPHHLISTGSEGIIGCNVDETLCQRLHALPCIDYLTCHIWPANWQWTSADRLWDALPNVYVKTQEYVDAHLRMAEKLQKPLVIEEFGYPRDSNLYTRSSGTRARDAFYGMVYRMLAESRETGGALAGLNFWGWGGEGKPAEKSVGSDGTSFEVSGNASGRIDTDDAPPAEDAKSDAAPSKIRNQWLPGDDYLCDPPHEPQGWYSVFDTDTTTLRAMEQ